MGDAPVWGMVILASTSLSTIALVNKHSLAVAFSNRMPAQLAQRGGMGLIPTTLLLMRLTLAARFFQIALRRPHGISAAMWLS
ncbi:hypothetical protein D7T58_17555 [Stenotrophomonas maltophilia]|nr:hypothetical protein [Stenotrophomonas maltophilia]MBA0470491.1 hypothetical protein [Stenotrophomonas maltophilia]MBA0478227.1 hypothetical protein [Stenotrophomonas maltophilia]MBA0486364.1 hypothetical protein [Stenotrophomonas maltophilia]